MQAGKITVLEGLRGYLALLVAVSHFLKYGGMLPERGVLASLFDASHAVEGFMILSGFVIAMPL